MAHWHYLHQGNRLVGTIIQYSPACFALSAPLVLLRVQTDMCHLRKLERSNLSYMKRWFGGCHCMSWRFIECELSRPFASARLNCNSVMWTHAEVENEVQVGGY